jgi:hypothetical protein
MLAEFSSLVRMDTMLCQGVVAGEDWFVELAKLCGESFSHVDRAVLATGATDSNRQIAAMRIFEAGDPATEKADDIIEHRDEIFLFIQKTDDFLVQSCQSTQIGAPIRVWQATHIENKIGIRRYPVLEAERFDKNRQGFGFSTVNPFPDRVGKFVNAGSGCIDDEVCRIIYVRENVSLGAYGLSQFGAVFCQWVAPS